jgi:diguanylate cyclase (GGDEF)-like protein
MARIGQKAPSTGKRILLIDDQKDYLESTIKLLEREGHKVTGVSSGEEGLELMKKEPFDLLLVDYYMPGGMNGEELVRRLREFDPYTQVILQTGYAGEHPPREMLRHLDIQGYHDKSDGPDRLLVWIDVGLKAAYTVQLLSRSKMGLQYILEVTPDLHKLQQLQDIFQGILYQISGLIGIVNSFIATMNVKENAKNESKPVGFLATFEEFALNIQVATGKYSGIKTPDQVLGESDISRIQTVLNTKKVHIDGERTIVPLCVRDESIGVIFLDQPVLNSHDVDLLQIFANQAAIAVYNANLYEMATVDHLTGVFVRRFFDQWLSRELRSSFRTQASCTLLMIDMDNLKSINDTVGHVVGDEALSIVGRVLKQATRLTDFVGRYGGDEFAVILPQSSAEQSQIVTERILRHLSEPVLEVRKGKIPISVSIGTCGIRPHTYSSEHIPRPVPQSYFERMGEIAIKMADEMLYNSKRSGDKSVSSVEIDWIPFE